MVNVPSVCAVNQPRNVWFARAGVGSVPCGEPPFLISEVGATVPLLALYDTVTSLGRTVMLQDKFMSCS